jgi:hypothetical protein
MDVAIAGVAEHGYWKVSSGRGSTDQTNVLAHLLNRDARVLDHLERAAILRQSGQDRARGVTDLPEPFGLRRRERGLDRGRPRLNCSRGAIDPVLERFRVIPFQLDQQGGFGAGAEPRPGSGPEACKLEERAVQQLDCGWLALTQRRHYQVQMIE